MKLRTKIFVVSFTVSAALLGGAIVALTALSADDDEVSLTALSAQADELAAMAKAMERGDTIEPDELRRLMTPIRRDIARRSILERDRKIATAASWSLFLGAEVLAALLVAAIAASALTSRWARLRDGILRIRRGGDIKPFFSGAKDEFGAVEAELDRLVEALSDRERMRSELRALQGWGEASAFLTHQARTPLASLSLSTQVALQKLEAGIEHGQRDNTDALTDAYAAIERSGAEAARLSSLFSRVRSLSGFKDPELRTLDPSEAFYEAVLTLAARGHDIDRNKARLEHSGSGPKPRFDRGYLVEAFTNLLNNSLEACAEHKLPFAARLRISASLDEYRMEYSDSVTGLDPELVKRVGSARFSTKADGMGLGVWLIDRICGLHGARLQTGMSEQGGLVFTMIFPIQEAVHG
ncbi:MAG: HAMP domain-containing sensor histidine kinase [Spirochaetia bacterium]|jgi:signal transduction histidine kinase|nr:HAMP domain-containing sensor histidine kinase [Spirochaetia bacterium]